ncbi:GNAT family N-acetyltransferase [Martelella endophytica]|uniref:GCN5 family acetyltransferase n=1 Tax=Martelella endophytica TaxID=1486262 RepID=A0A0D5LWA5_MAREN|nr:GNAT family N-acetyltransferase [Martelella endophytica]AJY47698.1 GCN5 family acetyltransferase [Martelella endophytica]
MRILSSDVRAAETADAEKIANVHWLTWQHAYAGIIPHRALQDMITRRNAAWWRKAIEGDATLLVLEVHGEPVGYATVGLNRSRSLPQEGEIYEIYLLPQFQGVGFGRTLFNEARRLLASLGCKGTICWSIDALEQASLFFSAMGGKPMAFAEESVGGRMLAKVSFVWD